MERRRSERGRIFRVNKLHFSSSKVRRSFVIKFCIMVVVGALISGAIIYLKSQATVTTVFEGSRLKIKSTADFILPAVLLSGSVIVIVVGSSVGAFALWMYRRIERLLFQMVHEIEEADAGNLNVQLRPEKNVEFKVMALSLNKLIRDFRKLIIDLRKDISKLESCFQEFGKEGKQEILERAKADLEGLKKKLSGFKT